MLSAGAVTEIEQDRVADRDFASLAPTTKSEAPGVVAAPVIVPVCAFSASPAGNDPEATFHAIGASPPTMESDDEYGSPAVAVGLGQAAMANPLPTVNSNGFSR
jgi:hypothetical protein